MTREEAMQIITSWLVSSKGEKGQCGYIEGWFYEKDVEAFKMAIEELKSERNDCHIDQVENIGEVSDGYHTFNQLYHQRAVLFATIVNQNKDKAWKSWKHEDGQFCFDKEREWFIVGVDTPEGSYTYHYEKKHWNLFDCKELDRGKHWDGHTEDDVTRLLSLPPAETDEAINMAIKALEQEPSTECSADRLKGKWVLDPNGMDWNIPAWRCSECGFVANYIGVEANVLGNNPMNWAGSNYCPNCGARMESDKK